MTQRPVDLSDLEPPAALAFGHGREALRAIGERWAETFEVVGGLRAEDRVLDIGCGPGRMALAIAQRFGEVGGYEGFDVRAEDIEWCRREIQPRWPRSRFTCLDLHSQIYRPLGQDDAGSLRFPYGSGAFDFALLTSVFTHLLPPAVCNYLGEVARVLRPGGRCLMTFFLLEPGSQTAIADGRARYSFPHSWTRHCAVERRDMPGKVVGYDLRFIERLCWLAGLEILRIELGSWAPRPHAGPPRHSQDVVVVQRTAGGRPLLRRVYKRRLLLGERLRVPERLRSLAERLGLGVPA